MTSAARPAAREGLRTVMFVGNNHDGTADVVDARTSEVLHRVDMIPDRDERLAEIRRDPVRLGFYLGMLARWGHLELSNRS